MTFFLKRQRLVTVAFRLRTGRRVTLRCSATESVLAARQRLLAALKDERLTLQDLVPSHDGLPLPDDDPVSRGSPASFKKTIQQRPRKRKARESSLSLERESL